MWRLGKITLIVLLVGLLSTNAGAHGKIRSRGGLSVGSGDGRYIRRDGGNSPTADIPWGSNKITGLTDPAASQDAATKEYVDTTLGGVYFNYFLSDTATGEGAPLDNDNLMYAAETGEAASTVSATTTADGTLIKSFVTEAAEPTFTILVPGTYTLYTHAEVDQTLGYKDNTIYWVLNAVDADGQNPTILMTSEESGVLTTSMTSYVLHANLATQTILGATERLTLEIFSNEAGAGSDPQVTITIEGDHDCRLAVLTTVTAFDDRYILESGDTSPAGTYTFTSDAFNITSSTTLKPDFSIINTNDDGNAPRIDLQKNGTSPADDDRLGVINFKGEDSGSTTTTFVQIVAESEEVNDGDEAGSFCLRVFHDDGTPAADDMFCILGDNGTPGQGYAAFNNDSKDMDFWIESDDEDHFFYIDAASNWLRVGDWDTNYTQFSSAGAITQVGSGGGTWLGVHDAGGATSFEIPNAAAPSLPNVTGEIAVDTDLITQGMMQVYLASAIANIPACTDTPADNEIPKYDSGTGTFSFEPDTGGASEINVLLKPQSAKLPTSNPAVIDAGNSGWRLLFDDTTQETATWEFILDDDYGSGTLYCDVFFSMASGEANEVQWECYVMAVTATTDNADWDTDSYDTVNEGTATTVAATAGRPYKQTITLTNDDSLAAGDMIRIKISTDSDDGTNDDATGDREFRYAVIRE